MSDIESMRRIDRRTSLFCYDSSRGHLLGPFVAEGEASLNIVPSAFGRRFPAQIRFKRQQSMGEGCASHRNKPVLGELSRKTTVTYLAFMHRTQQQQQHQQQQPRRAILEEISEDGDDDASPRSVEDRQRELLRQHKANKDQAASLSLREEKGQKKQRLMNATQIQEAERKAAQERRRLMAEAAAAEKEKAREQAEREAAQAEERRGQDERRRLKAEAAAKTKASQQAEREAALAERRAQDEQRRLKVAAAATEKARQQAQKVAAAANEKARQQAQLQAEQRAQEEARRREVSSPSFSCCSLILLGRGARWG
jgi:hypothetical protein